MGFPYPGGVILDRESQKGNPKAFHLPHPKVDGSPYDFSFSGLKTAVINLLHNAQQKGETVNVQDLAASFQATVAQILCDRFLLAAKDLGYDTLAVAGGVSANSGLRELLTRKCTQQGKALYFPPLSLCGDNGAMIASQGYYEYMAGVRAGMVSTRRPVCRWTRWIGREPFKFVYGQGMDRLDPPCFFVLDPTAISSGIGGKRLGRRMHIRLPWICAISAGEPICRHSFFAWKAAKWCKKGLSVHERNCTRISSDNFSKLCLLFGKKLTETK